jgi:two-component sensor histidine kinase
MTVADDQVTGLGWSFRRWPMSVKVVASLTCALLPLGGLATYVTASAYRQTIALAGHVSVQRWLALSIPLLMWLAALLIGWLIGNELIIKPLRRLRDAVERQRRGDTGVRLSSMDWMSVEMQSLAAAFDRMADDGLAHDAAMAAALDEQRRLTREVHHRVKNNLQIVASLLSIQARDTTDTAVGRAYSAVQARVGALALVHRWMYDDETARGVNLRALATDLCASLEQAIAVSEGTAPRLTCDVARFTVAQDTAVPIAFLITELVTVAARASAPNRAEIKVSARADGGIATLSVSCAIFCTDAMSDPTSAPVRVITGLARQMRAPLRHDPDSCTYTIEFAIPAG